MAIMLGIHAVTLLYKEDSMNRMFYLLAAIGFLGLVGTVEAQDSEVVGSEIDVAKAQAKSETKAEVEEIDGWQTKLSLGANFSSTSSSNVVGTADGNTMQFGIQLDGAAYWNKGRHQLLNEGKLLHQQTSTPQVPIFVKSADALELQSTYFYGMEKLSWLGPFARFRLSTSVFPGYVVGGADLVTDPTGVEIGGTTVDVNKNNDDPYNGTSDLNEDGVADELDAGIWEQSGRYEDDITKLQLSSAFEPLILKQVVGVLASPVDKGTKLKVGFHVGAGAEEAITQGGYVISDDKDTEVIELSLLQNYLSLGAEFEGAASGTLNEQISWRAGLTLFQPLITTAETDVSGFDLMNKDFSAKISVKLAKWASLDLNASAKEYPLIVKGWQLQYGLMLATNFNLI